MYYVMRASAPSLHRDSLITNVYCGIDFARFPEPELKKLLEIGTKVQAQWEGLGIGLGLDKSKLDAIEKDSKSDTFKCMTEVFEMWSRQEDNEYSWKKLAEVLCSEIEKQQRLLPFMYKELSIMYDK